jgi:hypothetical protein
MFYQHLLIIFLNNLIHHCYISLLSILFDLFSILLLNLYSFWIILANKYLQSLTTIFHLFSYSQYILHHASSNISSTIDSRHCTSLFSFPLNLNFSHQKNSSSIYIIILLTYNRISVRNIYNGVYDDIVD